MHDAQIAALKALKLNIRRAKVKTKGSTKVNKFFITDAHTAEKIMKVLLATFLYGCLMLPSINTLCHRPGRGAGFLSARKVATSHF